ncbi:MAG: hypothetical protein IJJ99_01620 [Oscillospiraceae bacterium]|nr:hypothetical protein [Oscillospiraceae bacterium]
MEILIILGAILVIVIQAFWATEMRKAAMEKGYPDAKYFWYSFLLGVLGALIVIALPDRGRQPETIVVPQPAPQQKTEPAANPKTEPVVNPKEDTSVMQPKERLEKNGVEIVDGRMCAAVEIIGDRIICPNCGTKQYGNRNVCYECGCKFIKKG